MERRLRNGQRVEAAGFILGSRVLIGNDGVR